MEGASAQAMDPAMKTQDADQHGDPTSMGIAELAIERRRDGGGEKIERHHPGKMFEIAELAADGGQRRGDDGLVERRQEQRDHEADDDGSDFALAERLAEPRLSCGRRVVD